MDYNKMSKKIIGWIKQQVNDAGLDGVILGASGGIDSSVAISLSKKAFPNNIIALVMPCGNIEKDENDAVKFLKNLNIEYKKINFEKLFDNLVSCVDKNNYSADLEHVENFTEKLALANSKARIRMIFLYYFAQINNYMVVGTGNRTEEELGYFTKYGDGGVDILPLADFFKREVIELGKILDVPKRILDKTPSGGLWKGQSDEKEIGLTYDEMEYGIRKYYKMKLIRELKIEKDKEHIIKKTAELIKKNQHKRRMPPKFEFEREV